MKKLFKFLKCYKNKYIDINYPILYQFNLKKNSVIIVKQGVWEYRYPFYGIILARNPLAVFSSLKVYDQKICAQH